MTSNNTHKQNGLAEVKLTGYKLQRSWFDFAMNNPDKVSPNHGILYFYCVELCNRLGWKKHFGLPAAVAMAATGIKSYNTYAKTLRELVEFGAIEIISKSRNQYTANIIALSNSDVAFNVAHEEASNKASDSANTVYINNKPKTNKPLNIDKDTYVSQAPEELKISDSKKDLFEENINIPFNTETPLNGKFDKNNSEEKKKGSAQKRKEISVFIKPTLEEVAAYCNERKNGIDPQQWIDHYTSNGWKVGKNPMKDWKAAVRTWEKNGINNNSNKNGRQEQTGTATDRYAKIPNCGTSKEGFSSTI